jgi:hypothetical protein
MKNKTTKKQTKQSVDEDVYLPDILGEQEFRDSIGKAMSTSKHKKELQYIVDEFETYKTFIQENIISCAYPSNDIYMFRFTYRHQKNLWKEVEVCANQSLSELAFYVVEEMGWMNDHLHAYFLSVQDGKKKTDYAYTMYEIGSEYVDNDQYPILHSNQVMVGNIDYKKHPKIGFVFDFGDNHQFFMEYKSKRKETKEDDFTPFPVLVDQRGVPMAQYPYIPEDIEEDEDLSKFLIKK